MFKRAVNTPVKYPAHMSKECADLVGKLLVKQPAGRLGVQRGGARDIKDHPWFADFNWSAFENRTMAAPYVPVVRSSLPVHGFLSPARRSL